MKFIDKGLEVDYSPNNVDNIHLFFSKTRIKTVIQHRRNHVQKSQGKISFPHSTLVGADVACPHQLIRADVGASDPHFRSDQCTYRKIRSAATLRLEQLQAQSERSINFMVMKHNNDPIEAAKFEIKSIIMFELIL
jgi:hypothetical protein